MAILAMHRFWLAACVAAAVVAFVAAAGNALAAGSVAAGRTKAIQYCSACHKVTASQAQPPAVYDRDADQHVFAPTFMSIGQKYAHNEAGIRRFVHLPQYPMPEQELSPADLEDLSAYILSLRSPKNRQ
ncbi:MAG TPA: c-type cytochrome [Rhizomicrobium sp.]|nr:c-type cytochrome [Rhizomicrobium sp.]